CHHARGQRTFRVDRVVDAVALDETFARSGDGDGAGGDGTGAVGEGGTFVSGPEVPRVTVEVDATARWVAETYPVDALDVLDDGRLRLCLPVTATPWLERLLLRLGPTARVVEADDPALVDAGARAARRVLDRYRG
ncbi:MAG TPA: WYL domain-containing protein, partial [Acidimicrobiales bacterium]